jgi:hypothetical protein
VDALGLGHLKDGLAFFRLDFLSVNGNGYHDLPNLLGWLPAAA